MQHFFVNTYLIKLYKHPLSTHFCIYPFESPHLFYGIWWELVNKPAIINWFPCVDKGCLYCLIKYIHTHTNIMGILSMQSRHVDSMDSFDRYRWQESQSFLLTSLLDGIQCLLRANEYKFLLVGQHWCVHVWESIGDVVYEFILTFPAVPSMSCSYLDGLQDWR